MKVEAGEEHHYENAAEGFPGTVNFFLGSSGSFGSSTAKTSTTTSLPKASWTSSTLEAHKSISENVVEASRAEMPRSSTSLCEGISYGENEEVSIL